MALTVKLLHINSLKVKIPWTDWSAGVEIQIENVFLVVSPLTAEHWDIEEVPPPPKGQYDSKT